MGEPHLRVRASGYGGSGYYNPITGDKVIGVTTALNALDPGGIVQWAVDQTAAYAVSHIDDLLTRTEQQGRGFLRYYWGRFKPADFDNPGVDIRDAHVGVLNDLADLGTRMHDWTEAYWEGGFPPELYRREEVEMIEAFLDWEAGRDVVVEHSELTVFGPDYGGTLDHIVTIDGTKYLLDKKSSRAVRDSHIAQLAAYGAATMAVKEVAADEPGAVEYKGKWFVEIPVPTFSEYAILQVRPNDTNYQGEFVPAFAQLHHVSHDQIAAGWDLFTAAKTAKFATKALATLRKEKA